jgi:hypothetical protein
VPGEKKLLAMVKLTRFHTEKTLRFLISLEKKKEWICSIRPAFLHGRNRLNKIPTSLSQREMRSGVQQRPHLGAINQL